MDALNSTLARRDRCPEMAGRRYFDAYRLDAGDLPSSCRELEPDLLRRMAEASSEGCPEISPREKARERESENVRRVQS